MLLKVWGLTVKRRGRLLKVWGLKFKKPPSWHRQGVIPDSLYRLSGMVLDGTNLGATKVSAEVRAAAVVAPGHQRRRPFRGLLSDPVINIYYICWFFRGDWTYAAGSPPPFLLVL